MSESSARSKTKSLVERLNCFSRMLFFSRISGEEKFGSRFFFPRAYPSKRPHLLLDFFQFSNFRVFVRFFAFFEFFEFSNFRVFVRFLL